MAKKKHKDKEKTSWHQHLRPETKHSLWAVFSFASVAILVLAYFGKAGLLGGYFFEALDVVFGRGFILAPIVFFFAGVSFLRSSGPHMVMSNFIGGSIFLMSSLGFLEIFLGPHQGGYVGFLVSYPLIRYFDVWASSVMLAALFVASLLILFNVPLRFRFGGAASADGEGGAIPSTKIAEPIVTNTLAAAASDSVANKESKKSDSAGEFHDEGAEVDENRTGFHLFSRKQSSRISASPGGLIPYAAPPLDFLEDTKGVPSSGDIKANANIIKRTLANFGIDVEMAEVSVGPSVTQYTLKPAEGIKLSRITALQNDLALALAAHPLRLEAPIPGKSLVGIEVPNRSIALVGLQSILGLEEFQKSPALTFAIGRDVTGKAIFADITKMPHLLIAGATGSGKSIAIHALLVGLLYKNSPQFLRFIMADPKRVELAVYNKIPHLLTPVITDAKKALLSLRWAVREMERRYEKLSEVQSRDIASYNVAMIARGEHNEILPNIIIIIDELADLMATYPREMEASVVRLAQMSRAVGIHLVVSTQRPSVEVITGLIKANITARIALQVASGVDSRTILDMSGAEKLLGNGDLLYLAGDTSKPRRIQGAFISEREVKNVVDFLAKQRDVFEAPSIVLEAQTTSWVDTIDDEDDDVDDELYEKARELVIEAAKASASYLQRRLRVGYARAARLLDLLEERGVIGPGDGAKPREVLIKKHGVEATEYAITPENKENDIPYTDFDE